MGTSAASDELGAWSASGGASPVESRLAGLVGKYCPMFSNTGLERNTKASVMPVSCLPCDCVTYHTFCRTSLLPNPPGSAEYTLRAPRSWFSSALRTRVSLRPIQDKSLGVPPGSASTATKELFSSGASSATALHIGKVDVSAPLSFRKSVCPDEYSTSLLH